MGINPERKKLYDDLGAARLVRAYTQTESSVLHLTNKMEEFPSTPYTEQNARDLTQATIALRHLGAELRSWHTFLWDKPQGDTIA